MKKLFTLLLLFSLLNQSFGSTVDYKKFFEGWDKGGEIVEGTKNLPDGRTIYYFYGKRCRPNTCETKRHIEVVGPIEPIVRHSELYIPSNEGVIIGRSDELIEINQNQAINDKNDLNINDITPVDLRISLRDNADPNEFLQPPEVDLNFSRQSDLGQAINQVLPEVALKVKDGIDNYNRMRDISKKMYHAYKQSQQASVRYIDALKNYQESKKDSAQINSGMNKVNMGLLASYLENNVSNSDELNQQKKNREQVKERVEDNFTYREYDYTSTAIDNISMEVDQAIDSKNYNKLAKYAEELYFQRDSENRKYAQDILDKFTNEQGIIQLEKISSDLNPGPFEYTEFQVKSRTPEHQLVQRIANQYQATFASTGELESMTPNEKESFLTGAVILTAGDFHLSSDTQKDLGESMLRASKLMLDSAMGFAEGLEESVTELVKSVPQLIELGSEVTKAFIDDPKEFANKTFELLTNIDVIESGISMAIKSLEDDFNTLSSGTSYARSKLIGKYTTDILIGMATGGITKTVKIAAKSGKIASVLNKAGKALNYIAKKTIPSTSFVRRGKYLKNLPSLNIINASTNSFRKSVTSDPVGALKALSQVKYSARKLGFDKASQLGEFIKSSTGKTWAKIKATGQAAADKGYKIFKKDVPISNELPSNGIYARVMPREHAELLKQGKGTLSKVKIDPTTGKEINEAFITKYDDIAKVSGYDNMSKRLGLYTDPDTTKLAKLGPDDVIVKFKFNDDVARTLQTPFEPIEGVRKYGFVNGGKTIGDASEYIIDNHAAKKGFIDLKSVVIEELKR